MQKDSFLGAGTMTQQLRALPALPKDTGSSPSTYTELTTVYNSRLRELGALLGTSQAPRMKWYTDICGGKKIKSKFKDAGLERWLSC